MKNNYSSKYNWFTDAKGGVAFTTTDASTSKGRNKNKKITCYKFKKERLYANECDAEDTARASSKKGTNFLMLKTIRRSTATLKKAIRMSLKMTITMTMQAVLIMGTGLLSFNMMLCALYKTREQFPRHGYFRWPIYS